jgi:hypothetical protein
MLDIYIYIYIFAVELTAAVPATNTSVGGSAALTCEMKAYIRPDSDFQWRKGDDIITNNARHSITFTEGFPGRARNGGTELVSSRFSALTIMDVRESDAGEYTCFERTTGESSIVELFVEQTPTESASTEQMSTQMSTEPTSTGMFLIEYRAA